MSNKDSGDGEFNMQLLKYGLLSLALAGALYCFMVFVADHAEKAQAIESIKPKVSKEIANDYLKRKYSAVSFKNVFYPLGDKESTDALGLKCQSKLDEHKDGFKTLLDKNNNMLLIENIDQKNPENSDYFGIRHTTESFVLSNGEEVNLKPFYECLNDILEVTLVSDENIANLINSPKYKSLKDEKNPEFLAKVADIKENERMTATDGYELIKIINENKNDSTQSDISSQNKQNNIEGM